MTFEEKLGFPTANHERIYKLIMDLICSDWKHLLRTETSQKFLLKSFCYANKDFSNIKDLQNLSNKKIYLTFQSKINK